MGTLDYLAPEQARDTHSADTRADIYSLGCTLYHMLTGQIPFPGGTATEKLLKHQMDVPPPVRQLAPNVLPDLAQVLAKMMAKDVDERYQTPAEVAEALSPWVDNSALRLGLGMGRAPRQQPTPSPPDAATSVSDGRPSGGPAGMGAGDALPSTIAASRAPGAMSARPRSPVMSAFRRVPGWGWVAAGMVGVALVGLMVLRPWNTHRAGRQIDVPEQPAGPRPVPPPSEQPGVRFINSIGMEMVYIPPGTLMMGRADGSQGSGNGDSPLHKVTITQGFYMSAHEVTQAQFEQTMGTNPSKFRKSGNYPVEQVRWHDADAFCQKLSLREGRPYRLPTEAQWEYACRAGSTTRFSFGDAETELTHYGWFADNSDGSPHPVGQKRPNAWGLYDMHGNVVEWCRDWFDRNYYAHSPAVDPAGPDDDRARDSHGRKTKVLRGGAWRTPWITCDSAWRYHPMNPHYDGQHGHFGFRVITPATPVPVDRETTPTPASPAPGGEAPFTNSIGMHMVPIPPGTFLMGSPLGEEKRREAEGPEHQVTLSRGFYMSAHEVTQQQYEAVKGTNPADPKGGGNFPVNRVSWHGAQGFCKKLSEREGRIYRLPTEAEWEYACRAGSTGRYCFGEADAQLHVYGWALGWSGDSFHPVGQKRPNAWGLFDMHGNLWEWCQDWHEEDYYAHSPSVDPTGPDSGSARALRGGSWVNSPWHCRCAHRFRFEPQATGPLFGFRVVCTSPPK